MAAPPQRLILQGRDKRPLVQSSSQSGAGRRRDPTPTDCTRMDRTQMQTIHMGMRTRKSQNPLQWAANTMLIKRAAEHMVRAPHHRLPATGTYTGSSTRGGLAPVGYPSKRREPSECEGAKALHGTGEAGHGTSTGGPASEEESKLPPVRGPGSVRETQAPLGGGADPPSETPSEPAEAGIEAGSDSTSNSSSTLGTDAPVGGSMSGSTPSGPVASDAPPPPGGGGTAPAPGGTSAAPRAPSKLPAGGSHSGGTATNGTSRADGDTLKDNGSNKTVTTTVGTQSSTATVPAPTGGDQAGRDKTGGGKSGSAGGTPPAAQEVAQASTGTLHKAARASDSPLSA
jgi:hypothetical protein